MATAAEKKKQTVTIPAAELIEDFALYPRTRVDDAHVSHIAQSIEAGEVPPPIIIDAESKRIIDGFHRTRAYRRVYGDDVVVDAEARTYPTEKDMYLDAMRYNARHGKSITGWERTCAILKAQRLNIKMDATARALGITTQRAERIISQKTGEIKRMHPATGKGKGTKTSEQVALKRSVHHMAGRKLTRKQVEAIPKLGGNDAAFLARQINTMLEASMVDLDSERTKEELRRLRDNLAEVDLD